jgi:hypothetical protein
MYDNRAGGKPAVGGGGSVAAGGSLKPKVPAICVITEILNFYIKVPI